MRKVRLLLIITILLYLSGCAHKPLCAPYTVLEASPCYNKGYMDGYDDGFNHGRFIGAMKVIETQQKGIKKASR